MRKLMAIFAISILAASTPSWALVGLGDINFDGSLEVSGNSANNETDFGNDPDGLGALTPNDHRGRTATRVRVGMDATVTEGVKARLEVIRTGMQYGDAPNSALVEEALFVFHNAYIDLEDLWGHNFRLGRQYVGNSGDLVWNISPKNDDNLTPNSITGILAQCRKYDFLNVDLFTGKAAEGDTITGATTDTDRNGGAGDVNLTSLDVVLPTLVPDGKVNVGYLLGDDSNAQVTSDDNRLRTLRVGINGGVSENMITYRAEFLQNMGQFNGAGLTSAGAATDLDYKGNAIDLGIGYNSPETEAGTFGVQVNYLMASGDDNVVDDKDDSFHDFSVMGFNTSDRLLGEIFGKSNVLGGGTPLGQGLNTAQTSGAVAAAAPGTTTQGQGLSVLNIGAMYKPSFLAKTTFRLDYYMFSRGEDSVQTTAGGAKVDVGDKYGNEIDLSYSYDHSDNVNIELGYAMLMPDDALVGTVVGYPVSGVPGAKDDTITKLFARAKVKWGGEGN